MVLPNEKELLLEVSRGNEHAFSELFLAYNRLLGNHIYRITDSAELAEEIVQDVFLKIWLNRQGLATVENFKSYLFVLSKNHALNCLRKLAKERAHQTSLEDNVIELVPDEVAPSNDYYHLLDLAIDHLPPQQQRVYLLSRHKRLKYDEIAKQMGLSRETVKKYLQGATHAITSFVRSSGNISAFVAVAWLFF